MVLLAEEDGTLCSVLTNGQLRNVKIEIISKTITQSCRA